MSNCKFYFLIDISIWLPIFNFAVKLQLNIVNNVQHSLSIVILLKKNKQ